MANANAPFNSRGTRIYHGQANGVIATCRLVARDGSGKLIACPTATRPQGVSPANYVAGDDMDYHRLGIATVETDGSAAVGEFVKADAGGLGKGIKDSSPGITTAGVVLALDATTNIADVELGSKAPGSRGTTMKKFTIAHGWIDTDEKKSAPVPPPADEPAPAPKPAAKPQPAPAPKKG